MPEAIISAKGTEAPTVRSGRFTAHTAYMDLAPELQAKLLDKIRVANSGMPSPQRFILPDNGMVHVVSHDRDGHPVHDYWRRKPSR